LAARRAEAETAAVPLLLLEAAVPPDELLEVEDPAPEELEELAPGAAEAVVAPTLAELPAEAEESPPEPQAARPQQIEASTA
jgi:hypothetical protein